MTWYEGSTLLHTLENIHIASDRNLIDCRFPVQYVIRPQNDEFHDYRGYAGRIEGGVFKKGDQVMVLPSGFSSTIKSIDTFNGALSEAYAPMSVAITLEDDIDISRGDMIVRKNNSPQPEQNIDIMLCWLSDTPLQPRGKYIIKHTSKEVRCMIKNILYKVDINTLHRIEGDQQIVSNDIARITLRTTQPLFIDSYSDNKSTGSIIIIDEATNNTVGAGMII
jgi:sulfate adenylyltransferase subunit 1